MCNVELQNGAQNAGRWSPLWILGLLTSLWLTDGELTFGLYWAGLMGWLEYRDGYYIYFDNVLAWILCLPSFSIHASSYCDIQFYSAFLIP